MYGYQCVLLLLKHFLFIIYIFNNNTKYCLDIFVRFLECRLTFLGQIKSLLK